MKLKTAAQRSVLIVIILALSMLIGYVYQAVGHRMDLQKHPREYTEYVSRYAAEYGVPEYILYGFILTQSNFQSNLVADDGKIGLMQMDPDIFQWLLTITKETLEPGILYDPETNIRYGTYLLSHWYTEYGRWNTVFAMYFAGEETVLAWMDNPLYSTENGNLLAIPDERIKDEVSALEDACNMYRDLYYKKNT